jgi:DNA invertase Pin-like site-specific DNA recombinase
VIVFAKLDRLARTVIDFRAFADEAARHGAALVSVAESLDLTTPAGKFVATILAAFAEMEATTIAGRTLDGISESRRLGPLDRQRAVRVSTGARTRDRAGQTLAPDPKASDIVREMARRVLDGEPLYKLALDLNRRG